MLNKKDLCRQGPNGNMWIFVPPGAKLFRDV